MSTAVVFDQPSAKKLSNALVQIPRRVAIKHQRIGLNAMGGVGRDVARQNVRKRTRLLEKSLIVKVTIPDASRNAAHHGKPARVDMGPSRKVKRPIHRGKAITEKRAANLRHKGTAVNRYQKPTRYAHLAEDQQPFIGPAQDAMATRGMARLQEKLRQGLEQEAAAVPK